MASLRATARSFLPDRLKVGQETLDLFILVRFQVRQPVRYKVYVMNNNNRFVYHGSPREFDAEFAIPKRNVRNQWNKNKNSWDVIFDQESFHATPYKWIGLAYTYKSAPFEINGKLIRYNMGVDLYGKSSEIEIFGKNSLEESLEVLFGDGGYLYYSDAADFFHKEGLGDLEVITEKQVKPVRVERVDDPVTEMKKLGVVFKFFDLELPENEKFRNPY